MCEMAEYQSLRFKMLGAGCLSKERKRQISGWLWAISITVCSKMACRAQVNARSSAARASTYPALFGKRHEFDDELSCHMRSRGKAEICGKQVDEQQHVLAAADAARAAAEYEKRK